MQSWRCTSPRLGTRWSSAAGGKKEEEPGMIPSMEEVAAVIIVTRVPLSTTTTNSTSSTMEADRVHLEVTMDNLHKEATTPTTSSTMHTCSRNNRLCTTTLNMRCRCSSTTPAWASSTLEDLLPHLLQCTRGDLLEKSSLRSEF